MIVNKLLALALLFLQGSRAFHAFSINSHRLPSTKLAFLSPSVKTISSVTTPFHMAASDNDDKTAKEKAYDAVDAVQDAADDVRDSVHDAAQDIKEEIDPDRAKGLWGKTKDKVVDAKDAVKEKVVDAKDAVKEKAGDIKDAVKEKAEDAKDKVFGE